MSSDPQDFVQLRRLLAVKRHEQPPPGYFDRFSREVVARIKAGDRGEGVRHENWVQRLLAKLEAKPVFAGAFGAAVCAVLVSGLLGSEDAGMASSGGTMNPVMSQASAPYASPAAPVMALNEVAPTEPALPSEADAAALNRLFDFQPQVQIQPASQQWTVPSGN